MKHSLLHLHHHHLLSLLVQFGIQMLHLVNKKVYLLMVEVVVVVNLIFKKSLMEKLRKVLKVLSELESEEVNLILEMMKGKEKEEIKFNQQKLQ